MTKDKLISEMIDALRAVPRSVPGFLQPIEGRVLMISTGIRSQLGVKIFGGNLETLQKRCLRSGKTGPCSPRRDGRGCEPGSRENHGWKSVRTVTPCSRTDSA